MQFNTPITELIRRRISCRTYQKEFIQQEHLELLVKFAEENQTGPLGNQIRYKISAGVESDSKALKGLGTYGFIQDPAGFIVGAVGENAGALFDFGYQVEKIILKATEAGLGSCWLGGTFTKSRFAAMMDLQSGEDIPSVIAIGYPADQQVFVDRMTRILAGADRRLPWGKIFFDQSFQTPLLPEAAGEFGDILKMVRLAPSASNKQPWRIIKGENTWHFYLQRTRKYPPTAFKLLINGADLQKIDLGIAMAHFDLSAMEKRISGSWVNHDPGLDLQDDLTEYCISWKIK
jgi:nitroreductase